MKKISVLGVVTFAILVIAIVSMNGCAKGGDGAAVFTLRTSSSANQ